MINLKKPLNYYTNMNKIADLGLQITAQNKGGKNRTWLSGWVLFDLWDTQLYKCMLHAVFPQHFAVFQELCSPLIKQSDLSRELMENNSHVVR